MKGLKLCLVCFLIFLASCSKSKIPQLPSAKLFKKATAEEKKNLIKAFSEERKHLAKFQGTMQLEIEKSVFKKKTNVALAYSYPNSLRAEILPTNFATPVALIVADNDRLSFIDRQKLEAWMGSITPERVEKMLGVPLNINELIHWLSASWLVDDESFSGGIFSNLDLKDEKVLKSLKIYVSDKKDKALVHLNLSDNREVRLLLSGVSSGPYIVSSDLWSSGDRRVYTVYDYPVNENKEENNISLPSSSSSWLINEDAKINIKGLKGEFSPSWSKKLEKKLFSVKVPKKFKKRPLRDFKAISE